ncbi:MAG: hypothetical protein AAGK97_12380, partial [Bacteroidota bacterium]
LDGSGLSGGIFSSLGSANAQAGDINLQASELITVDGITEDGNVSRIFNVVSSESSGNAGTISINTANLSVTNGAQISASTFGLGDGGVVSINASESVVLEEGENNSFTSIYSNVGSSGIGNSGGINIITELLEVNRGGQIQSIVFGGEGNSGKIIIDSNTVSLDGRSVDDSPSGAFSLITEGGVGNAGGLEITADSFAMTNRAQILSNTAGMGNAGNVDILVEDEVNLVNSSIIAEVTEGTGMGEGGDINITTSSLLLLDGSSLLADAENMGDAGNININASENVILSGEGVSAFPGATDLFPSQISTTAESNATGKSGNIDISANELSIDEGFISSSTFNSENAANVSVSANNLSLTNGGRISASTFGQGDAGNLSIFANNIELDGEGGSLSGFFASVGSEATGQGGNIIVETDSLTLTDGGQIAANVEIMGRGNAGTLEILANDSIAIDGTSSEGAPTAITSIVNGGFETEGGIGNGGDITISTSSLSLTDGGRVSATSLGRGNIIVETDSLT